MVMRNRNDGADARRWWDDLPPRVRDRVAPPDPAGDGPAGDPRPVVSTGELARDLTWLALLFFGIAVANMLFLLLALAFINGR